MCIHTQNIAIFINSTWTATKNKQLTCIFEGNEGNNAFVCAIKSIATGKYFFIDYNLNRIDIDVVIMGAACILF